MSFSSTAANNVFIDLATFSEQEGFIYGGPDSITWMVGSVQKSNWFSFIPIILRQTATPDFGLKNISSSLNRSGDYVLHTWFSAQIPKVELVQPGGVGGIFLDASVRWTRNLMHNLFDRIWISFNELVVQEFDSFWLDFNYQFRVRGSKRVGYRNMIGDIASMTTAVGPGIALGTGGYFNCVFPFWFSEDSGVALPVAALPFNDIKINYNFRKWEELLVIFPGTSAVGGPGGPGTGRAATINDIFVFGQAGKRASLIDAQTNAHYLVVHNDERIKMGDAPRDILIHQVQAAQYSSFKDVSSRSSFDLRLSHSIVLICFAAQNISIFDFAKGTNGYEWSNYTTEPNYTGLDPIANSILLYESTVRFNNRSDYFSLVKPFLLSDAIPDEPGFHIYSYALHPWATLTPCGSTNYSKLANVSILHDMTPAALAAAGIGTPGGVPQDQDGITIQYPDSTGALQNFFQKWRHIVNVRNWNIVRVANGSLGQPVL